MEQVGLGGLFWLSLGLALTGALMPGPLLMVTVAGVAARGFAAAPRVMLGHAVLELGVVAGLFWGLQRVLTHSPWVVGAIGLIGGLVLLRMGAGIFTAVRRGEVRLTLEDEPTQERRGKARDVSAGILASASNPYWVLWWVTSGAAFALLALRQGLPGLTVFYLGHISGDLVWYLLVGALVAAGRHSVNERVYHGFLVGSAAFLVFLALSFIAYGVSALAQHL